MAKRKPRGIVNYKSREEKSLGRRKFLRNMLGISLTVGLYFGSTSSSYESFGNYFSPENPSKAELFENYENIGRYLASEMKDAPLRTGKWRLETLYEGTDGRDSFYEEILDLPKNIGLSLDFYLGFFDSIKNCSDCDLLKGSESSAQASINELGLVPMVNINEEKRRKFIFPSVLGSPSNIEDMFFRFPIKTPEVFVNYLDNLKNQDLLPHEIRRHIETLGIISYFDAFEEFPYHKLLDFSCESRAYNINMSRTDRTIDEVDFKDEALRVAIDLGLIRKGTIEDLIENYQKIIEYSSNIEQQGFNRVRLEEAKYSDREFEDISYLTEVYAILSDLKSEKFESELSLESIDDYLNIANESLYRDTLGLAKSVNFRNFVGIHEALLLANGVLLNPTKGAGLVSLLFSPEIDTSQNFITIGNDDGVYKFRCIEGPERNRVVTLDLNKSPEQLLAERNRTPEITDEQNEEKQ